MPTVLFIDDHTCGSRSLVQKLRNVGYDVQVALDAEEAIGLFRLYAVDAVIMDCHVESRSRGHVASVLRKASPDAAIIMLSSFCRVPCPRFQQADACVHKGDSSVLLGALRSALCLRNYGLIQSIAA